MKPKHWYSLAFLTLVLSRPASADVIYSNLLDTAIPLNFTGVTVTLPGGGTINPFFGGVAVANNDLFQPGRTVAGNLGALQNFTVGSTIDTNLLLGTGYGGSQTHLGNTFTAGQEGHIGFKLNGTNFGWMRVVFTGNTAGAVIKDWAYDDSGAAIVTGRVQQSAPVSGEQTFTLSPQGTESFTLGSQITDTGGNINSVVKTGTGTSVLTGTNTYTGDTTITAGTLKVTGTIGTSDVTVNNGGILASGSTGTVGKDVTVDSGGIFAPGGAGTVGTASVAGDLTMASGSIFEWDLDGNTATQGAGTVESPYVFDQVTVTGSLEIQSGAIFKVIQNSGMNFENAFWHTNQTWSNIFSQTTLTSGWANNTAVNVYDTNGSLQTAVSTYGSFSISGTSLTWTAVPEPTSALAGLLLGAGLLRRRRR